MKKKIVLMLCVISCLMMVAGCSLVKENENYNKADLQSTAETFVNQWFTYDFSSTVAQYKDQMTSDQIQQYKDYIKMQKQHGAMKKVEDTECTTSTDSATVALTVSTEKGKDLVFTVTYDENAEISDWKVEEYQSIGDIMGKAGLNTIMSMAIVFCVLIFISLLIACFKFIGKIQDKMTKEEVQTESVVQAPVVEENLTDDLELVAVITAAIAAAGESESADGLVVRSIVRRS
ncbi:MAG: OadG family protein [Butyribacter sp.]|nr:OadG family protein [bacterium]MDY3854756.1 OadG family protein [Butyribacter sp.]